MMNVSYTQLDQSYAFDNENTAETYQDVDENLSCEIGDSKQETSTDDNENETTTTTTTSITHEENGIPGSFGDNRYIEGSASPMSSTEYNSLLLAIASFEDPEKGIDTESVQTGITCDTAESYYTLLTTTTSPSKQETPISQNRIFENSHQPLSVDQEVQYQPLPSNASPNIIVTSLPKLDNFKFCAHGICWTATAILCSWIASIMSIIALKSPNFIELKDPLYVDATFETVSHVGLNRFQLCYNATLLGKSECFYYDLDSDTVDDSIFELTRCLITIATMMGVFMTIFVTSAIYWQTINLRPIGFGFLAVYFMQTIMTFFVFESDLCSEHDCQKGKGCVQLLVGGSLWLVACIACGGMDTVKFHRLLRAQKKAQRQMKKQNIVNIPPPHTPPTPATTLSDIETTLSHDTNVASLLEEQTPINLSNGYEIMQCMENIIVDNAPTLVPTIPTL